MKQDILISKFNKLPDNYQDEVLDFSDFLLLKSKREKHSFEQIFDKNYLEFSYNKQSEKKNISLEEVAELMLSEYLENPEFSDFNVLDAEEFLGYCVLINKINNENRNKKYFNWYCQRI